MSNQRYRTRSVHFLLLGVLALLVLPACGGGGTGLALQPLFRIVTGTLPVITTGERLDLEIGLEGGCGGPYRMAVIDGTAPRGLAFDAGTRGDGPDAVHDHKLSGQILESGAFEFTIQVTDTACTPELTAFATYTWTIESGALTVIDTQPASTPADAYGRDGRYEDVPAMPESVYGAFTAIDLIAVGGQPPYVCALIDDPSDPDDGALPLGVSIAAESLSVVGTPTSLAPNGRPFRLTLRVTDATGATALQKYQWAITTPAITQTDPLALPGAVAGRPYDHQIVVQSGVPPFRFEFVDDVPQTDSSQFVYEAGLPPRFDSNSGFTVDVTGVASNRLTADGGANGGSVATYPARDATGPYAPMPPEGLFLEEGGAEAGRIHGVPERVGDFTVHVHVASTLVPNARGQHLFSTHNIHVDAAEDVEIDAQITVEGRFSDKAPYSNLPELEVRLPYNPDGGADGLSLLASGGVQHSGFFPAPHASQRLPNAPVPEGTYTWTIDWDPQTEGRNPPGGVELLGHGTLVSRSPGTLRRQSAQVVRMTCADYQLPANTDSRLVTVNIGPDKVIVTESTRSWTGISNLDTDSEPFAPNDTQMRIKRMDFLSDGSARRAALDATDLPFGHEVPITAGLAAEANPLGALLSGAGGGDADMDLLRVTVNPTGWWDDVHGMNPNGARAFQHADPNIGNARRGQAGPTSTTHGNWQPSVSSVDLPNARAVTHDPAQGAYADGGRLYAFESANRFGVFIIRQDATVYVPFAMQKSSTAGGGGFGDGIFEARSLGTQNSLLRTVQMTVSPSGRFAAVKIKRSPTDQLESAGNSRIVLVSLTGEKVFSGKPWKILQAGVTATGDGARYLPANSMALTDTHLYFLIATDRFLPYQSWAGHYLMRYRIQGGAVGASLLPSDGANANWTQAPYAPLQTTFQHWYLSPYREGSIATGSWPYHRYWAEGGANFIENGLAPTPFRVSRDGRACAFLAGSNQFSTRHSLVYSNHAWVDFDGSGARQASSIRRHATMGSGRGYAIASGPEEYGMFGRFNGPTTGLEISDDGLRVAFVHNTTQNAVSADIPANSSSHELMRNRDDVVCCSTTLADAWKDTSRTVEKKVSASAFGGSHRWRFGALAFTADGDGLVFWAGAPVLSATTTSPTYQMSYQLSGTFYADGDLDATASVVTSMVPVSAGGSPDGAARVYTSAGSSFNPPSVGGLNNRYGAILPCGGFLSRNREFMYLCSYGALAASDGTAARLVGLNISRLSAGSVNGHANGRGFAVSNWPSRRGFLGVNAYPGYAYGTAYLNTPNGTQGAGRQVMAKDTGCVFWTSGYQYASAAQSTSSTWGGPVFPTHRYGNYGYGGVGIYGFNADLGGAVAVMNPPGTTESGTRTRERMHFMEVADDGRTMVYVTSGEARYSRYDREQVVSVRNIDFATANGAMSPAFDPKQDARILETTDGRAGEAMAILNQGRDVFYAFKGKATNETQLELVRARYSAAGVPSFTRASALSGRMNVLFAGR